MASSKHGRIATAVSVFFAIVPPLVGLRFSMPDFLELPVLFLYFLALLAGILMVLASYILAQTLVPLLRCFILSKWGRGEPPTKCKIFEENQVVYKRSVGSGDHYYFYDITVHEVRVLYRTRSMREGEAIQLRVTSHEPIAMERMRVCRGLPKIASVEGTPSHREILIDLLRFLVVAGMYLLLVCFLCTLSLRMVDSYYETDKARSTLMMSLVYGFVLVPFYTVGMLLCPAGCETVIERDVEDLFALGSILEADEDDEIDKVAEDAETEMVCLEPEEC